MEFSFNFLQENENNNHNVLIKFLNSSLVNLMFYLFCANSELPINLNITTLIGKIFANVDFTVSQSLNEANESVQNFVKNLDDNKENKENETNDTNNDMNNEIEKEIKVNRKDTNI